MTYLWQERKRNALGLPWTFTIYAFNEERFFVKSGFFTQKQDEVRLYRIMDLSIKRTFMQRLFKLGTIQVHSSDKSLGCFEVKNIKNVEDVKEQLSALVENQRDKKRVSTREFVSDMPGDEF